MFIFTYLIKRKIISITSTTFNSVTYIKLYLVILQKNGSAISYIIFLRHEELRLYNKPMSHLDYSLVVSPINPVMYRHTHTSQGTSGILTAN